MGLANCIGPINMGSVRAYGGWGYSVTIFGDVFPLWQHFKGLWLIVKGLFSIWKNLNLFWQIYYAVELIFIAAIGQISKK